MFDLFIGGSTYEDSEPVTAKTCTVPLLLHAQISVSSGRKAIPYISALLVPRRSSRISLPVCVSHIRMRVPLDEVVASSLPEGGTVNVVRSLV